MTDKEEKELVLLIQKKLNQIGRENTITLLVTIVETLFRAKK